MKRQGSCEIAFQPNQLPNAGQGPSCMPMSNGTPDTQRMEKIVSLCKRRGFIFQASEIYGGLNGVWDYGPLGVELKRNLKDYWWRVMVRERDDVVGIDGAILTHRAVLKASGHEDTFSDPMVDCLLTQKRFRADQIEPQNGTVFSYEGAFDESNRSSAEQFLGTTIEVSTALITALSDPSITTKLIVTPEGDKMRFAELNFSREPFSVLVRKGENVERARKIAREF